MFRRVSHVNTQIQKHTNTQIHKYTNKQREVGVHKEEKSFWLWVLGSFKGAKRGQRGQKWAKGGQKVEKVLDGQLGSCVRGQPDRSDSRQMSTTVSRKEKIPLEIEVQCCKCFIGLTFSLTCDGDFLKIWISKKISSLQAKNMKRWETFKCVYV